MRNVFFASALAMLAAIALLVAGPAMAQPKVSGSAATAFGQVNWEDESLDATDKIVSVDGSGLATMIESNVIVSGSDGAMDYYFRIRARGVQGSTRAKNFGEATFNDGQLQTVRVRVGWNATDAFRIEMGRMPGIGGTGAADIRQVRAPSGFRHAVNQIAMWDAGAVNLIFNAGSVRAGLAISSNCQVDCSNAGTATISNRYAEQTILPHVNVKLGSGMAVAARYAMSSSQADGVDADGVTPLEEESIDSSALGVEFKMDTGSFYVGAEVYSATMGCLGTGCEEPTYQSIGLAVKVAGVEAQFSTQTESVDEDPGTGTKETMESTDQVLSVAYVIPVSGGVVFPEIATASQDRDVFDSTGKKVTLTDSGTMVRFGMKMGF